MLILPYCLRLEESLSSFEYLLRSRGSIENKRALSLIGWGEVLSCVCRLPFFPKGKKLKLFVAA
jgi:hypothetical protein